jgi:hypothetical protein
VIPIPFLAEELHESTSKSPRQPLNAPEHPFKKSKDTAEA